MNIDVKKLIKCIAIPLIVGAVAGFLTKDSMKIFEQLNQPPLSPPGWLFPVVWTILYLLMGISSYIILESDKKDVSAEMSIYHYQLVLNFLWPIFFFNFGWYLFSFVWLLLLIILVAIMIWQFYQVSKVAAYINIPYLMWLIFAAYLNFGVWILNK